MRAYVQVEPINATTSQGVWTRSHECGAYGNICKHFVWFYFFSNHFETGTKFQFWNLQLGDLLRADLTWSWVSTRPLWCSGTLYLTNCHLTATSNARFWVWVHVLVNLVAMTFLFTMNLCLPWVLNFNLSQARLLKETACNYVFSVLVHGIPSISAWISIHQNSQKLFFAKTSLGH